MPSLQEELEKKLGIKDTQKKDKKRKPTNNSGVVHKKRKQNDSRKTIRCQYCDRDILSRFMEEHLKTMHPLPPKNSQGFIKCDICQMGILKNFLAIHKKIKHPIMNKEKISKKEKPVNNSGYILHPPFDNKVKFALSEDKDFKSPDAWVSNKVIFQSENGQTIQSYGLDPMNIYIGLDFGTSYTKAVIRFSQDSYVVDWSGISNFTNPYTLPTELALDKNNNFNVGHAPDSKIFSNLKIPLLEGTATEEDEDKVIAYLSLVLRYIRHWWYKNDKSPGSFIDKVHALSWHVNVGLPAKSYKETKILKQYESVIKDAWRESFNQNENENQRKFEDVGDVEINCFSEFLAQMQTYLKHSQRENDLHLLCDVGAGTVDVVGFNVHTDDNSETLLPEFSAEVENIGTHYLFHRRLMSLNTQINSSKIHDARQVLTTEDFAREYNADIQLIEGTDKGYIEDLSTLLIKVLSQMKSNRYGNSPSWNGILRTFICGGASKTPIVQAAINKARDKFKSLKVIDFPVPNNIQTESIDVENFQRICVAYGLAFDPFNMPKYKDENKPWKPPKPPIREGLGGNYDK
jgi:hypothetical protein